MQCAEGGPTVASRRGLRWLPRIRRGRGGRGPGARRAGQLASRRGWVRGSLEDQTEAVELESFSWDLAEVSFFWFIVLAGFHFSKLCFELF